MTAGVAGPIAGHHAHVYYDRGSRAAAAQLRDDLGRTFSARLGRWREAPVGPHPSSMVQVAFAACRTGRGACTP